MMPMLRILSRGLADAGVEVEVFSDAYHLDLKRDLNKSRVTSL